MKQPGTPLWVWIVVIAAGIGLGLGLRPLIQGGLGGGGSGSAAQTPAVRCAGPDGSELALTEFIESGLSGTDVTYSRTYRLERPGQAPLQFSTNVSDKDNAPTNCGDVRFGPGARVAFSRGRTVSVVELVGPTVQNFDARSDKDLTAIVLEPRWKLGLKLEDYEMSAPNIAEDGKNGSVTLQRVKSDRSFPTAFLFNTQNGGATWTLDKASSLRGF